MLAASHISKMCGRSAAVRANCPNCVNSVADDVCSWTANDTGGSSDRRHVTAAATTVTCRGRRSGPRRPTFHRRIDVCRPTIMQTLDRRDFWLRIVTGSVFRILSQLYCSHITGMIVLYSLHTVHIRRILLLLQSCAPFRLYVVV